MNENNEAQSYISQNPKVLQKLLHRYRDAYFLSAAAVGFGGLIKAIGVIQGVIIIIGSLLAAKDAGPSLLIGGLVLASVIGLLFYLFGVLVAAQGQILRASLDGAVNTSPFLTAENKAAVMSLNTSSVSNRSNKSTSTILGSSDKCGICGKDLSRAEKMDSEEPRCRKHRYE